MTDIVITTESMTTQSPAETVYQNIFLGSGLAIAGNLLISKYTHARIAVDPIQRHYTCFPLWWLGLTLMVLGEIGNFSAYGFAPASLVAPLGTTTVIANMIIAVTCLKEKLRPEDLFGSALAVVGAFLLVFFSQKKEEVMDANQITVNLLRTAFIIYVCFEIVVLIVLFFLKYYFRMENVLVLLLITSLLASFTVISAKGCSSMIQLSFAGFLQIQYAVFWVMLLVIYLNQAMKAFDATVVVPTNFVFFTISAILAGIIFYNEFWGMGGLEVFMFLFGCLMCFVGVYFITAGRAKAHLDDLDRKSIQSVQSATSSQTVYTDIFPSWLLSSVNQSEVQPRAEPQQRALIDNEEFPEATLPPESATAYESNKDAVEGRSYGAVEK